MKKILFYIPNLDGDGIPIIWLIKIKEYQKLGFQTFVSNGEMITRISKIGNVYKYKSPSIKKIIEIKPTISKWRYLLYAVNKNLKSIKLIPKLQSMKFDVIYTPSSVLDYLFIPFILSFLNKHPVWVTVFDNTVPLMGKGNPFIRLLAWIFFQVSILLLIRSDRVYTITSSLKSYLICRGLNDKEIQITGCGVEDKVLTRAKKDKKYDFEGLYVGRIHENKGVFDLLCVLKDVVDVYPLAKMAIMGDGDLTTKNKFIKKINSLGLEKNVVMLGFKSGIKKYNIIKSCKSFWYLSYDDSFGVALLEAVCLGKKAFVYDLEAFRYLYSHDEVVFHKVGDNKAVSRSIINFLKSTKFEDHPAKNLQKKWSWSTIVKLEAKSLNGLL